MFSGGDEESCREEAYTQLTFESHPCGVLASGLVNCLAGICEDRRKLSSFLFPAHLCPSPTGALGHLFASI